MERRYAWNGIARTKEKQLPLHFALRFMRPPRLSKNFHPFTIPNNDLPRKNYAHYWTERGGKATVETNFAFVWRDERGFVYASPNRHFLRLKIDKNCANVTSIEDINDFFNDSFLFFPFSSSPPLPSSRVYESIDAHFRVNRR